MMRCGFSILFQVVLCESDVSFCRVVVFACNGGLVNY